MFVPFYRYRMPRALFPAFILLLLTGACQQPATKVPEEKLFTGAWHMALDLDTTSAYKELPFQFELARKGSGWQMTIHNQDEAIVVDSIVLNGDSIRIRMPFFDSEFRGMVKGQKLFQGLWYNHYKGPDYTIPFTATAGEQPRFAKAVVTASTDVSGDWEVHFTDDGDDEPAIGIFSVDHGHVKGSFATETGDLRFLEGVTTKDSLFLSSFNGSQAFLFSAAIRPDSLLGEFRSGHHWKQPWYAVRNPHFALADDETMTQLDMKYPVAFSFPDTEGTMHSLSDEKYRAHAVVVEMMATWCPNGMDESRIPDARDENSADPGHDVSRIEDVPLPAQVGLEPGGEIPRRIRRRHADVAQVAGAVARGNVLGAAKGDRQMRVVPAHAALLLECLRCRTGHSRVLVAEFDTLVHELADGLHACPAGRRVAEQGPGPCQERVAI